jgi:type II secretory pathway pseudopilin PulG
MKFIKINKKAKGFTLIEILLVVGFMALAGLAIYTIYNQVSLGNSANQEGRNLDSIRAGTKTLFGGTKNYASVTNAVLNDGRVTPDTMRAVPYVAGDTSITNSFGGDVTIAPTSLGGGTNNGFRVTYNAVPGAVCSKLVPGAGTAWDQVTVAGTVVKTFGTGSLDIAALTTACAGDAGTGITILFDSL